MFPFFIKSLVSDSYKEERDKTPLNVNMIKHLRTSEHSLGGTRQKVYTIEFVGCDVTWRYESISDRNLEYEFMVTNSWNIYEDSQKPQLIKG